MTGMQAACPLCNSSSLISIGKPRIEPFLNQFIRKDYVVVQCSDCSFYYVFPKIDFTPDDWVKIYGNEYFTPMTKWHLNYRIKSIKSRFDRLEKAANHKIKRFLDFGPGEGYAIKESLSRGLETYGIDIYDNREPFAKNDEVNFFTGTIFEANYNENFFDCIYLDSVLEHVMDPLKYLQEIYRILNDGGVLYVGVPNEDSLFNQFKKILFRMIGKGYISPFIDPFRSPYHINGFNEKTLTKISRKAGLKIIEIRNFACRTEFLKFRIYTRGFWIALIFWPIYLVSIPLQKEVYFDAILRK